jgi:hypothetical protein
LDTEHSDDAFDEGFAEGMAAGDLAPDPLVTVLPLLEQDKFVGVSVFEISASFYMLVFNAAQGLHRTVLQCGSAANLKLILSRLSRQGSSRLSC